MMIDFAIGVAGLGLAILSPVLSVVFPAIDRKWGARGFVAGLLIIGGALGALMYPADQHTGW